MRLFLYGVLTGVLLATPAAAQPASNDSKTVSPQDQAAKDSKAPPAKTGHAATDPVTPAAAPQEVKEDPMANYNILGNAVGDGLGVPR